MRKIKIEIETINAAFTEDPEIEIKRILTELINKDINNFIPNPLPLYDINGNKIGFLKII